MVYSVKACLPTLIYGLDSVSISGKCIKQLESTQGGIIKHVYGLCQLLRVLYINLSNIAVITTELSTHCVIYFYMIFI